MAEEEPKTKLGRPTPDKRLNRTSFPVTAERLRVFLQVLEKTGSKMAAARAATPWSTGQQGGYSTFRKELKKNPEFAEAAEDAYEVFLGRLDHEIIFRAFEPTERPIVSQGEIIGVEKKYDNNLLMRVAQRHDPKWNPKTQIEHSGQVTHGVMVVNALPATDEEWEEKYGGEKAIDVDSQEED